MCFFTVGLLDIDLCGPSIPKMLNLAGKEVHQCDEGWLPVFTDETQTLGMYLLKRCSCCDLTSFSLFRCDVHWILAKQRYRSCSMAWS